MESKIHVTAICELNDTAICELSDSELDVVTGGQAFQPRSPLGDIEKGIVATVDSIVFAAETVLRNCS